MSPTSPSLSTPWRCAAALLGTLLFVSLVAVGLVLPWLEQDRRYSAEIERLSDQIDRFGRMAAPLPQLLATEGKITDDPAIGSFYLSGKTANLAAAELQNRLKQMVEGAGGTLVSSQLLPTQDQEGSQVVSVSLRLNSTTEALFDILYKIESARPLLFVDTLSVREQKRRTARPTRKGQQPPETIHDLSVRLDVYGYLRGGKA